MLSFDAFRRWQKAQVKSAAGPRARNAQQRIWKPTFEHLEERTLLTAGAFLQGYAFNGIAPFQSGQGISGVTVKLYQSSVQVGQATTDPSGYYLFEDGNGTVFNDNLTPGTYVLVETPPAGQTSNVDLSTGDALDSPVATTFNSLPAIQVTILDPTQWTDTLVGNGFGQDATVSYNPFFSNVTAFVGQFNIQLANGGFLNSNIVSYCTDLLDDIGVPSTFPFTPSPAVQSWPNGGEIAYLYNHYASTTSLGGPAGLVNSNAQAAGLQEAMWTLIYGNAFVPDLSDTNVANAYNAYLSDASGQSEAAVYVQAEGTGTNGDQGMIVSQSLNFGNTIPQQTAPHISTTPSQTTVPLGTSSVTLNDTAMLSDVTANAGGMITFTLYYNGGSSPVDTETVLVSGPGNYTTPTGYMTPTTGTVTGTYQWDASYSGDSNNGMVADNNSTNEQVVVSPASPGITTTPNVTTVTLGTTSVTLNDTAVLSGGYSPTGTITFTLYQGSTLVDTETATVSGNGSYTTPTGYKLLTTGIVTGTYQWDASYSGDSNNKMVADSNSTNEQVVVSPASPGITTTPNVTTVTLGATSVTLKDTAVLSGGYSPTGTVTFTLYQGSTLLDTETVSVTSGNGSYTTPTGYTLPTTAVTGTYQWDATYSGDSNNKMVSDNNATNEQVTVGKPNITVCKTADCATISAGQTAGFTVTITNNGTTTATGVTLNDPLPAGQGNDITWVIDTSKGNPTDFTISGPKGNQDLTLASSFNGTLAAGQSISVHITGPTTTLDVSSTCSSQCSIPCNFNGTPICSGDYIWFNCDLNIQNLCTTQPTTVCFSSQTISFTCGSKNYNLPCPNGTITFSPTTTCASSAFNSGTNSWVTCEPCSGLAGNEFVCALPFFVPSGGLAGGIKNVTWVGTCSENANNPINWQWAAACYTNLTTDCTKINVKPCDSNSASQYKNSDHCGTPENYTCYVTGGACGGGGSNCTGSYSSTCCIMPSCGCGGTGTLTNIATVTANYQGPVQSAATITITTGAISISGTKYNDLTGDGFSCDDRGLGGVTISLYKESNNTAGLQTGTGGDTLVGTMTTATNGTYSFGNLTPGTYYVQETVPSVDIQTGGGPNGTAGNTYYTICAQSGQSYCGNNFDDYLMPSCMPTNVTYKVTAPCGTSTTVTNLSGNTQQGDTVSVTFTVTMTEQITIVSYVAPGSTYNQATAYLQQIFCEATGTYSSGTHTLTIQIPNCYYQIDVICGPAICELAPTTYNGCAYGPDSANILYHAQNRFISSDNGGTQCCTSSTLQSADCGTISFWNSNNGKSLICQLNGGGSSGTATSLGNWLACNFPHFFGGQCDTTNSCEKNLTNCNNAAVFSFFQTLYKGTGNSQTYAKILAAALSTYCTDTTLAGGTYAHSYGFNTSTNGSGMNTCNVGSSGSSLGCASGSCETVLWLLHTVDQIATCTSNLPMSAIDAVFDEDWV